MNKHKRIDLRTVARLVIGLTAVLLASQASIAQERLPDAPPASLPAPSAPSAPSAPATAQDLVPPDYRLGPEDVLDIAVWREDTLKGQFLVRPDGYISFPLAGEVLAEGRLASEIREDIVGKLSKFLSDPVVSVTVVKVAAQKIYVIGRVAKPGEFVSGRYIDVLQALSMAGGLTPFAKPNEIRIMRKLPGGKQQVLPFRYNDVVKGKELEQNIILKPGDVVVVP
jgi:polysaccharide export outer membrane protein